MVRLFLKNYRDVDNLHMLLWLLKDVCWINHWVWSGVFFIIPNVAIAIWICIKTLQFPMRFVASLSVLCWIVANSIWMLDEFFDLKLVSWAVAIFITGCICSLLGIESSISLRNKLINN